MSVGWVEKGWVEKGWVEKGRVEKGWVEKGPVEKGWVSVGRVEKGRVSVPFPAARPRLLPPVWQRDRRRHHVCILVIIICGECTQTAVCRSWQSVHKAAVLIARTFASVLSAVPASTREA